MDDWLLISMEIGSIFVYELLCLLNVSHLVVSLALPFGVTGGLMNVLHEVPAVLMTVALNFSSSCHEGRQDAAVCRC